MRISDWSSDVCSSDLVVHRVQHAGVVPGRGTDDAGDLGAVVAVAGGGVVGMPAVEDPVPFVAVLVVHRRGGDLRAHGHDVVGRSEDRSVGEEGVSTCSSRSLPYYAKQNVL